MLEIHDLDAAVRVKARNIRRTIRYSGPSHEVAEGGSVDSALLPDYGIPLEGSEYLWSAGMGLSLAGVPAGGVKLSLDEYRAAQDGLLPDSQRRPLSQGRPPDRRRSSVRGRPAVPHRPRRRR